MDKLVDIEKEQIMNTSRRSASYVFTADANSIVDMEEITTLRKGIKAVNQCIKEERVNGNNTQEYRVVIRGRGPRREKAIADGLVNDSYDNNLPVRHATHFDVYVYRVSC